MSLLGSACREAEPDAREARGEEFGRIDQLSEEQKKYLAAWQEGT